MANSSKSRHIARYRAGMDQVAEIDSDVAADVEDYVLWLESQITTKRKMIQVLRVEIEELGGGFDRHQFRQGVDEYAKNSQ